MKMCHHSSAKQPDDAKNCVRLHNITVRALTNIKTRMNSKSQEARSVRQTASASENLANIKEDAFAQSSWNRLNFNLRRPYGELVELASKPRLKCSVEALVVSKPKQLCTGLQRNFTRTNPSSERRSIRAVQSGGGLGSQIAHCAGNKDHQQ